MKAFPRLIAILAIAVSLGACSTAPGVFNGLGSDVMSMLIIYRTDDKPLTRQQYEAVGKMAKKMGITIGYQLSSPVEAALSSGGAYLAAGALGGATQGHFYPGALVGAAAGYNGVVYGLGGVVGGTVSYSYANVYAIASSTETALRDEEKDGATEFRRLHVVAAFVRSRNAEGSPAPGLVPGWSGPKAGTQTPR